MLFNTVSLLAALPAVLALPTYSIPKSFTKFLLANACTYPEAYEIQNFQTFTPAAGNSTTADISFSFNDKDTNIQTFCQRNSTSKNVGKPDLAARYACDNTVVEFIWQSEKLTMIETACPGNTGYVLKPSGITYTNANITVEPTDGRLLGP
jgi:hypothetical protein